MRSWEENTVLHGNIHPPPNTVCSSSGGVLWYTWGIRKGWSIYSLFKLLGMGCILQALQSAKACLSSLLNLVWTFFFNASHPCVCTTFSWVTLRYSNTELKLGRCNEARLQPQTRQGLLVLPLGLYSKCKLCAPWNYTHVILVVVWRWNFGIFILLIPGCPWQILLQRGQFGE